MTHHNFATIDGHQIFYREAGAKDAPTLLLLHGFPTSSHMFRNLIPPLADRYHVIAPDLPGFGFSKSPDREQFGYTFENLAAVIDRFTERSASIAMASTYSITAPPSDCAWHSHIQSGSRRSSPRTATPTKRG